MLNPKKLICLSFSLLSVQAVATDLNTSIIYGEDNRIETYQASELEKKLAASTAGMIKNTKLVKAGDNLMLPPQSLGKEMNLCAGQKFAKQPSAVVCSGFLVAPDLLVTAGHCITEKTDCDTVSWVFDYKVNADTQKTDIIIPKKNVYKCKEIIDAKLVHTETDKVDYALVKLDRPVEGRTPLKVRKEGKVELNTKLVVIGHPSGLPQKVAGDAKVLENTDKHFFQTNLDTFGGNSGSAVFNAETGTVEGILVRGAQDYEEDASGCIKVHKTTQQIEDFSKYGESVSRITDIKALMELI